MVVPAMVAQVGTVTGDLMVIATVVLAMDDPVVIVMVDLVMGALMVTAMVDRVATVTVATAIGIVIVVIDVAIGVVIGGMDLVVQTAPTTAGGTIGTTAGVAGIGVVIGFEATMGLGSITGLLAGSLLGLVWVVGTSSTIARALGTGGVGTRPTA